MLTTLYGLSLCVEPQKMQPVDYCSIRMIGFHVISHRVLELIMWHQFHYKEDAVGESGPVG